MRKIQTKKHRELQADLQVHPPVNYETETPPIKEKKKKKIYQLNQWVDDIDISDVVE